MAEQCRVSFLERFVAYMGVMLCRTPMSNTSVESRYVGGAEQSKKEYPTLDNDIGV